MRMLLRSKKREMSRKQQQEKTKKTEKKKKDDDAVEELLRAAQDDMLLSLSVDSHASHRRRRLSDVDRRFQALKVKIADDSGGIHADVDVDHDLKAVLGDDLSARFAALKASMPVPSSSSVAASHATDDVTEDNIDDVDEVEKLMRWAKDAARLDPSPPSDDED